MVALQDVHIHRHPFLHVNVVVGVFFVPNIAVSRYEILERLRLNGVYTSLFKRTRIDTCRYEMFRIVHIHHILKQRRSGFEEVAFLVNAVGFVGCAILFQYTSAAIFKVHHLMKAERIARIACQDESRHARLPYNHFVVLARIAYGKFYRSFSCVVVGFGNKLQGVFLPYDLQPFGLFALLQIIQATLDVYIYGSGSASLRQHQFAVGNVQRDVGRALLYHDFFNRQAAVYKHIATSFRASCVGIYLHNNLVSVLCEVNPLLRGGCNPLFAVGGNGNGCFAHLVGELQFLVRNA